MKLPKDVSGDELARKLGSVGYRVTRQTGSHLQLTCDNPSQHHITVPKHNPLRLGASSSILGDIAAHLRVSREELAERLFD